MFTLNTNTKYCCSAPIVPAARVPAAALLTILGLAAPDPSLFCSHSLFQSPKLGLLFTTIVPAIATITFINEDQYLITRSVGSYGINEIIQFERP